MVFMQVFMVLVGAHRSSRSNFLREPCNRHTGKYSYLLVLFILCLCLWVLLHFHYNKEVVIVVVAVSCS